MKKTQAMNFKNTVVVGPKPKRLHAAFIAFLALCLPNPVFSQESPATKARLTALTPSVFRMNSQGESRTAAASQSAIRQQLGTIQTVGHVEPTFGQSEVQSLAFLNGEQLTQQFVAALGDQLKGSVQGSLVTIELPGTTSDPSQAGRMPANPLQPRQLQASASEGTCTMVVDRARNNVQFTGSPANVAAWSKVAGRLDSVEGKLGTRHLLMLPKESAGAVANSLVRSSQLIQDRGQSIYKIRLASIAASATNASRLASWQDEPTPPPSNQEGAPDSLDDSVIQGEGTPSPTDGISISIDETTGALIVNGTAADVAKLKRIIQQLGEKAIANRPQSEIKPLVNANSQNLAPVIQQLYNDVYLSRLGTATVTAIPQPNAVLISGSKEALEEISSIVDKLDVETEARGNFQVFRIKYMAATNAANRLGSFFNVSVAGGAAGGGFQAQNNSVTAQPILIIPDPRSNLIIMKAGTSELAQALELLSEIDVVDGEGMANQEVRIIPLRNSVAADMAQVIQAAINGSVPGVAPVQAIGGNNQFGGGQQQNQVQANQDPSVAATGLRLKLMTIDKQTGVVKSGILFDIKIVSDPSSNSLIVTGPPESLPLVEELIKQLDRLPSAETQLKVFTIVNGDAEELFTMLTELFGQQQQQNGGFGGQTTTGLDRLPLQSGSRDQSLVNLRFALERRTNTILASGSVGDLQVVQDLLLVLDRQNSIRFITKNVRLSNLPADEMATAVNGWQQARADLAGNDPATAGPNVVVRQQIVVTPEPISNSLIITASPENMAEILQLIHTLDRRPPMVAIQVMIAEVTLNDTQEFGLEFGVQDSILFDRGLGTGLGYPFNSSAIGNSLDATGLAGRETFAGQGLVNLNVGRTNSSLGYGGLVLSAGNESINVLLRALKDKQRVRVLSKPHLMTIDNLQSRVQVGQRVPYITGSSQNAFGGFNNAITLLDVGVILEVVPRVSPDGMITLLVNTENSSVGSEANGVAIAVDQNGNTVRQAPINIIESITTVLSRSGQTIVLSGLLRETKTYTKRGIPYLSDLPRLGPLFSFQSESEVRSELLIFLTPTLIQSDEDVSLYNQGEMDRMNWCMEDVLKLNGPIGYAGQGSFYQDSGPFTVYPDIDPVGAGIPAVLRNEVQYLNGSMMIPPSIHQAPAGEPTIHQAPAGEPTIPTSLQTQPGGSNSADNSESAAEEPKKSENFFRNVFTKQKPANGG